MISRFRGIAKEKNSNEMIWFGDPVITLLSFLCLFILLALIKIFQTMVDSKSHSKFARFAGNQRRPSYRLVHGSTQEIVSMKSEAMGRPLNLSHDIQSTVQPHIHSWTKIYGRSFLQWYGTQAQLVIGGPELWKEILNNKERAYPKREPPPYVKKLLGDGLASTEGEKWGKLRKLANHAFHGDILRSMIPTMTTTML
nr:cytochrome P450 CYP749A22-like [Malus domestica]